MDRHEHWQRVYTTKAEQDVSWFESVPAVSLRLMEAAGLTTETCVLDVGGGDSRLIDHLVVRGLKCLAVLDVSEAALQRAQARLGDKAAVPVWIASDVIGDWFLKPVDIWHDRAVFHFLTAPADRRTYLRQLTRSLAPGGAFIIATFACGMTAIRWFRDDRGRSIAERGEETLRFELIPRAGGTRLVLVNELEPGGAARNAAGWEGCLDALAGIDPGEDAWRPRFDRYAAAFEPTLGPQEGPPPGYQGKEAEDGNRQGG